MDQLWEKYRQRLIQSGIVYDEKKQTWSNPRTGIEKSNVEVFSNFCQFMSSKSSASYTSCTSEGKSDLTMIATPKNISNRRSSHFDKKELMEMIVDNGEPGDPRFSITSKNQQNTSGYLANCFLPRVSLKSQKWVRTKNTEKNTRAVLEPMTERFPKFCDIAFVDGRWVRNSLKRSFDSIDEMEQSYNHSNTSSFWKDRRTICIFFSDKAS